MYETKDKTIIIKNLYHMLSYAFRVLRQTNYEDVEKTDFKEAADLLAAILAKGVAQQIKQGLHREYVEKSETLPVIRGKLDMPDTIRNRIRCNPNAACDFDELSVDTLMNRILKTTMKALLRIDGVEPERKAALKKNLVFFDGVGDLPSLRIPWNRLRFERNNRNYRMLVRICSMILDGMVQEKSEDGKFRLAAFEEKFMPWVYENFILEYYRRNRKDLNAAHTQIPWDFREIENEKGREYIPAMKTDIVLRKDGKVLIIDAKYYGHILKASHLNARPKLPPANLYQIFAYVKNWKTSEKKEVSGLLLYARTNELNVPYCRCDIGGNTIGAQTLNLNVRFSEVENQLHKIAGEFFDGGSPETA